MWEQIRSNRIRSAWIVAVLGTLLVAMGAGLGFYLGGGAPEATLVGAGAALAIWAVQWLIAARGGDDIMMRIAGAREIQKQHHPQLVNVVEEMAIAANLGTKPRVFIVDDPAPNAFATGRRPDKAAVSVTTGLLSILDRDELQGVVAHEIAHIRNRDVALMTTAGIMIGSIVLLAEVGRRALWFGGARRSRSSKEGGGGQAVVMIVAILLMILAPILAQLVYFSLSRRREYLADASGAQFTRYPEGLASALEKLGGKKVAQSDQSRVTAPMYIVAPLRAGAMAASSAFSTHPPLDKRVKILRSMGGGAGLDSYQEAYKKIEGGGSGIIGARSLAGAEHLAAVKPQAGPADEGTAQRSRQASDAFLAGSGYAMVDCPGCGARLKVPPRMRARLRACPRCQTPLSSS